MDLQAEGSWGLKFNCDTSVSKSFPQIAHIYSLGHSLFGFPNLNHFLFTEQDKEILFSKGKKKKKTSVKDIRVHV